MNDFGKRARDRLAVGLRPELFDEAGLPRVAERAAGAWVEDTQGRRYIDLVMGHGALLLGHAPDCITHALRQQLESGTLLTLPHRLEVDVAERLTSLIPGAERVAFGKNGSDVCTAAARIARAVTGRPGILQFGYHGFHDWCAAVNPAAAGLPPGLRESVHTLEYGDLATVRAIFTEHSSRIAAVFVEPLRTAPVDVAWLEGLRDITQAHGALLIFDEMVTGFRIHRGGAQQRFGVTADLACFGKALAHGMPLAALCGPENLVARVTDVAYGMTTRGEALSLAAARAALDHYAQHDPTPRLAASGQRIRADFTDRCAAIGSSLRLQGDPSMMAFTTSDGAERLAFLRACHAEGLITNGTLLPSLVHEPLLDEIAERLARAVRRSRRRAAPPP